MNRPFDSLRLGSVPDAYRRFFTAAVASFVALTAVPAASFGSGAEEQATSTQVQDSNSLISDPLIHNSRFIYSREEKLNFDLELYLRETAPHLLPSRELISHWSAFFTISPRVVLTLIELKTGWVTAQSPTSKNLTQPFGDLSTAKTFSNQYRDVLDRLSQFFYESPEGPHGLRADSAADLALLQLLGPDSKSLDIERFQDVYRKLFPAEKPLAERDDSFQVLTKALPPPGFLQLPYGVGNSWLHGATHVNSGQPQGIQSSVDFLRSFVSWGTDVSNLWVTAAHSGRVVVYSSCYMEVLGSQGWSTQYYHLDNIVVNSGQSVNRNQRISNYAGIESQALCNGGRATHPHVHFSLQRNGQFSTLHDVQLSNYRVQAGRFSYDTNCSFSWLERGNFRSCPFGPAVLNDGGIVLNPPQNLSAEALTNARIRLGWSHDSTSEQGFEIERFRDGGFRRIATVPASERSYIDTNLPPGAHRYRIRATGSANASPYSNIANATSGEQSPSNLSALVLSTSEVELTWTDESDTETGYAIESKTGTGAFQLLTTLEPNSESTLINGLVPSTSYTFRIRATGQLGNSDYSDEITALTFTDNPQPCVPDEQTFCLTDERFAVEVTWKNESGEVGPGHPVAGGSADSGMIWFFEKENWEMLVKVLDACASNNRFWVFAAAATGVEYTLTLTDTLTGHQVEYFKPLGPPAPSITDTDAFATCAANTPAPLNP